MCNGIFILLLNLNLNRVFNCVADIFAILLDQLETVFKGYIACEI